MKTIIETRIKELKEKHAKIEDGIKGAQQYINQQLAELNGTKGAIAALETLLSEIPNPQSPIPNPQS